MITPTVGRVVWFWRRQSDREQGGQPQAAIITYVWDSHKVNLAVFTHDGGVVGYDNIRLFQSDEKISAEWWEPFCEWMPYQKGQAAKTEALEANALSISTHAGQS